MSASASIEFQKLHGSGNDFIVIEEACFPEDLEWVKRICDRHRGVGADGVLVVSMDSPTPRMTIYNRDGTRPEMCGNGVRCVARWLVESRGFPSEFTLDSDAGPRRCTVESGDPWRVEVDMGVALVSEVVRAGTSIGEIEGRHVDMGNPHFVVFVDEMPAIPRIDRMGRELNDRHTDFKAGVNLEFVVHDGDEARVVVYERGVGRTEACGTGACAVAAAAWESGRHPEGRVLRVRLPGGALDIERRDGTVWMTGDAELVFKGELDSEWMQSRGFGDKESP